ncbi:methyl-accepting chemotaxis protein [Lachnospiraceae bacterium C1.1]|nr:methyl-accepting chemotaxis protein [Lachnospiraceae bacterium C1.1]
MANNEAKEELKEEITERKLKKSISTLLLSILLPVTIVGIVVIILVITGQAEKTIRSLSFSDLKAETAVNAESLSMVYEDIESKYDKYIEILESTDFESEEKLFEFLEATVYYEDEADFLITVGFEDDSYVLSNHQRLDESWKPSERPWYKQAWEIEGYSNTEPYIDSTTGNLGISIVKKFTLKSGKKGAICIDAYLDNMHDQVAALTPMGSGKSALLDFEHQYIVSFFDEEFEGKAFSEVDDEFVTGAVEYMNQNSNDVAKINTINGKTYIYAVDVPGTSWTLISTVPESATLKELRHFQMISYILMIIIVIVIALIILYTVRNYVAQPVKALARKIEMVSAGDFTAEFKPGKGDEIGLIRDELREYTEKMRTSLREIQSTAEELKKEAEHSKDAAKSMTEQTGEQSNSMQQIQEAMEGMTNAVSELAGNATELAGAVNELTEKGNEANDTVIRLVEQAETGQKDMSSVQDNMDHICDSMDEMNKVVIGVGESAEKITGIVEMIDSIAMQTNLLSLNASIEAARAGEAGKGFAVVAGEIAKLAQDSSESAGKIAEIIHDITEQIRVLSEKSQANVNAISSSAEAVTTAGDTFERIYKELNDTSSTMQNMIKMMGGVDGIASSVAAISEEQSASSEEVTATVENLATSAQRVAEESKGVDESANIVAESAVSIGEELGKFKID